MRILPIAEGIQMVSVNAEGFLFEGMWDLPHGVSINSYVVGKEEVVLIDGICGWDQTEAGLHAFLEEAGIELENIKHVVLNHMEPDHTEWITSFLEIYSDVEFYCSKPAYKLLEHYFGKTDRITVVGEGDVLEIGDGHKLTFISAPGVHWPDTIMTFEETTKTLFSCDNFGAFGSLTHLTDEGCEEKDLVFLETQQQRYYADILATFSTQVGRSVQKAREKNPAIIAPGHGMVWKKDVNRIMDDYDRYVRYAKGTAKEEVLIVRGSMYGMSDIMAKHIEEILEREGIPYTSVPVNTTDLGTILQYAWSATGIIAVASTYEFNLFPPMSYAIEEMGTKKVQGRVGFYTGSSGWSGGGKKHFEEIIERKKMNWDLVEGYEFRGIPSDEDKKIAEERVLEVVQKIKARFDQ